VSARYECRLVDMRFFSTAPIRFTNSIDIAATPQRLFEIFEDADSWPVWAPVIRKVTWTSPKPFGVGTTRTVDTKGDVTAYEEFIAWDPGRRLAFRFNASSRPDMDAFGEDYIVDATPDGCRVIWTIAASPTGAGRYVMPLLKPLMKLVFNRYLKNLKKYAEA
jgi:uncharacterized protein YndB with AHSA1/START domain